MVSQDETTHEYTVRLTPEAAYRRHQELAQVILMIEGQIDAKGLVRASDLTAAQMDELLALYEAWSDTGVYESGDLHTFDGALFRCVQGHTAQPTWKPPSVPSLRTPETPAGVIPAWTQPQGSHDAFPMGALVTHIGKTWESQHVANVWEPPTEWAEVV